MSQGPSGGLATRSAPESSVPIRNGLVTQRGYLSKHGSTKRRRDEKLARARTLGAWQTINYRQQPDWDEVALTLTAGVGVDHILELGGPETYARSINALASGGHIHQIGVLTGFGPTPNLWPLQFKNANIHGILVGSVAHFNALNAFLSQHQITPVIDQEFAYTQASEALDYLASAQHFGKIVINLQS